MSGTKYSVNVVVYDGEEVLYIAELRSNLSKTSTTIDEAASPRVNLLELSRWFGQLRQTTEDMYYMGRVRQLSEQAREEIKKALNEGDDLSAAPF